MPVLLTVFAPFFDCAASARAAEGPARASERRATWRAREMLRSMPSSSTAPRVGALSGRSLSERSRFDLRSRSLQYNAYEAFRATSAGDARGLLVPDPGASAKGLR